MERGIQIGERAIRIGVTGKMGSGKSMMTRVMAEEGIKVIYTDELAKQLMEEDPELRDELIPLLGEKAYAEGRLNRSYIASRIFADSTLRAQVEAAVHPRVSENMEVTFLESEPRTMVAVESALILQTYLWASFDYIVLVNSSDEIVIKRLTSSGRFTEEDVRNRLREQGFDKISREEVDFVLENNGSEEQFVKSARSMVALLKMLSNREMPEIPLHQVPEEEG